MKMANKFKLAVFIILYAVVFNIAAQTTLLDKQDISSHKNNNPKELLTRITKESDLNIPKEVEILYHSKSDRGDVATESIFLSTVPFIKPGNAESSYSTIKSLYAVIKQVLPKTDLGEPIGDVYFVTINNKYGQWRAQWLDTTTGHFLYLSNIN